MTVDELIAALRKLSDEGHGDLPVYVGPYNDDPDPVWCVTEVVL